MSRIVSLFDSTELVPRIGTGRQRKRGYMAAGTVTIAA